MEAKTRSSEQVSAAETDDTRNSGSGERETGGRRCAGVQACRSDGGFALLSVCPGTPPRSPGLECGLVGGRCPHSGSLHKQYGLKDALCKRAKGAFKDVSSQDVGSLILFLISNEHLKW
jgi:hypothetical protein